MNSRIYIPIVGALILMAVFASNLFAQGVNDHAEQIRELMDLFSSERQFSGVVLVAEAGDVIFEGAYGLADIEARIPVTLTTPFCIGSMSKQFASLITMQLVAQGKLELENRVTSYLTDYPKPQGDSITIHHLLNHTSGIPQDNPVEGAFAENKYRYNSPEEIRGYFQDSALLFSPGQGFQYSNFNYNLLIIITEKVSGLAYSQLLTELVLEPLELSQTGVVGVPTSEQQLANGYEYGFLEEPGVAQPSHPSTCKGAGDLYSNIYDLMKWDRALYTDLMLPENLKTKMFTPWENSFGYGWQIGGFPLGNGSDSVTAIFHDGGIPGFQSIIIRIPDRERLIVILSNAREPWIHTRLSRVRQDIAPAILAVLYNKDYQLPARSAAYVLAVADTVPGSSPIDEHFERLMRESRMNYSFNPEEFYCVGLSYAWEKKYDKAAKFLKIAVEELGVDHMADAWQCHNVYGEALFMLGMIEPGCAQFERSLDLKPDNSFAIRALKAAEPYRKSDTH